MPTYTKIDDNTINTVENFGSIEYTILLSDIDMQIIKIETELKTTKDKYTAERLTEEKKELGKFSTILKKLTVVKI